MTTYTDCFGDEVTAADFDDYVDPKYMRRLRAHPDCRDPEHPGCADCEEVHQDDCFADDEPVPYYSNKEA